ncbi:hypothetical protein [Flavobacterium sp.]|uniref:hypothetical protein n=1 Tax=Flavobacterium sp. TaxID=239 RepID=UPI0025BED317|nr:hypothetical protein [Flavobacterium sp.]
MYDSKNKKKKVVRTSIALHHREDQIENTLNEFDLSIYPEDENDVSRDRFIKAKITFGILVLLAFLFSFIALLIMRFIN